MVGLTPEDRERRGEAIRRVSDAFWGRAFKDWTEADWAELETEIAR